MGFKIPQMPVQESGEFDMQRAMESTMRRVECNNLDIETLEAYLSSQGDGDKPEDVHSFYQQVRQRVALNMEALKNLAEGRGNEEKIGELLLPVYFMNRLGVAPKEPRTIWSGFSPSGAEIYSRLKTKPGMLMGRGVINMGPRHMLRTAELIGFHKKQEEMALDIDDVNLGQLNDAMTLNPNLTSSIMRERLGISAEDIEKIMQKLTAYQKEHPQEKK